MIRHRFASLVDKAKRVTTKTNDIWYYPGQNQLIPF